MRSEWYDRQGNPITAKQYQALRAVAAFIDALLGA